MKSKMEILAELNAILDMDKRENEIVDGEENPKEQTEEKEVRRVVKER